MNIKILCVGKIKEKFYRDAISEYSKRLSKYCSLEIVEVNDEKTSENSTENEINIIKDKEGERILKHIKDKDYAIALAIQGKQQDSVAFSKYIENLGITGNSSICFIIGGSLGLSDAVMKSCNDSISFSKMTFTHQMVRLLLVEQVYRAFKINRGEKYHW